MRDKERLYRELVDDVRSFYRCQEELCKSDAVYLKWCDDCEEINLWTYWQGLNNLDAEIMLVGQDWGEVKESSIIENIRAINKGTRLDYQFDKDNPTDRNLVKLFHSIGIEIPCGVRDNRLLFTNFVLGYRSKGLSGHFKTRWIQECVPFFLRLVRIVEPKIIICLGKSALQGVLRAFEMPTKIGSYNNYISGPQNPRKVLLPSGKPVLIFAMAHCGVIGTMNRNRNSHGKTGLGLQKEDWAKIRIAIEQI